MEVFLVIFSIVLAILLFPAAVFVWKRISFLIKLKNTCSRLGYTLIPTHFFWFLANFNGGRCDCYVQTVGQMYSVKLCGGSSKTFIDFVDDTHYSRRSIRFHISPALPVPQETRKKKFDFRYRFPENLRESQMTPIILMDPMPLKVTYRRKGIGNGDWTEEGYFYDRKGFFRLLGEETADCPEGADKAKSI